MLGFEIGGVVVVVQLDEMRVAGGDDLGDQETV